MAPRIPLFGLATLVFLASSARLPAGTGTWQRIEGGDWSNPSYWSGVVPNGIGDVARFCAHRPLDDAEITLDVPVTLGTIQFETRHDLTIRGNTLTLHGAGTDDATITMGLESGHLAIAADVDLVSDTTVRGRARIETPLLFQRLVRGDGHLTIEHGHVFLTQDSTYTGTTIIDGGLVRATHQNGFGSASAPTVVGGRNAAIELWVPIGESIRLDNASGFAFTGAIVSHGGSGTRTISGDVDLGSVGSYVGGHRHAVIGGAVTGGFLRKVGSGALTLTGALSFTGRAEVGRDGEGGSLGVRDQAAFHTTSELIANAGGSIGAIGSAEASDMIGDTVPLTLNGGRFGFRGSGGTDSTEHVGSITLNRNLSGIIVSQSSDLLTSTLVAEAVARRSGAIVEFANGDRGALGGGATTDPRVLFSNAPDVDNGIMGGWALVTDERSFLSDFATYHLVHGVRSIGAGGRPAQVSGAAATANVLAEDSLNPLVADTTINSLKIANNDPPDTPIDLDLGTHALNIDSGGMLRQFRNATTIFNGRLTAGGTRPGAELFATIKQATTTISASIVDNAGGAVGLTKSGRGTLVISGHNSYSGPTVVNGAGLGSTESGMLIVTAPEAIPSDNTVIVNGGEYRINFDTDVPIDLGGLELRDGGAITTQFGSVAENFDVTIDAGTYTFESGTVVAKLAGDGTLSKRTDGTVRLKGDNAGLTGDVIVHDGLLVAEHRRAAGTGRVTVHDAGRFILEADTVSTDVVLAGGELAPANPENTVGSHRTLIGSVEVTADSRILSYDGLAIGQVDTVDLDLQGPITISPNVVLEIIGPNGLDVFGDLNLGAGAELRAEQQEISVMPTAGSVIGGSGTIDASVVIANGAVVSPGLSTGALNLANATLDDGGFYDWEIRDAEGSAGSGHDLLNVADDLVMAASSSNPFRIRVRGLGPGGAAGAISRFHRGRGYEWPIASAGQLLQFNPATIAIDTSEFETHNPVDVGSRFSVAASDNRIILRYEVVPEPATSAVLSLGAILLAGRCGRRCVSIHRPFSSSAVADERDETDDDQGAENDEDCQGDTSHDGTHGQTLIHRSRTEVDRMSTKVNAAFRTLNRVQHDQRAAFRTWHTGVGAVSIVGESKRVVF